VALLMGERLIDLGVVVFEGGVETTAEASGERLIVDEEAVFGGVNESLEFGMKGDARNDEVKVGVVLDLTPPCVQHAGKAEAGSTSLGGGDILKGGSTLAQDEWIEDFGIAQAQAAQLCGQREGDHEVGHGQESCFLFGSPDLLIESTTLRAGTVIAAVVGVVLGLAAAALIEPPAEGARSAREHTVHGPVVGGAQVLPVSTGVLMPVLTEQLCEVESHEEEVLVKPLVACRPVGAARVVVVGESFECVASFLLADLGDVEIADGVLDRAVAEVSSDLKDGCPTFEHVSGERMAQCVSGDVIVGAR